MTPRRPHLSCLELFLFTMATTASAQLVTYDWPGEATFSDKYRVFLACGSEPEREVQVLMSPARFRGDYRASELQGRTFSFVPVSFDPAAGPLRVRVVKTFGGPTEEVTVHPRSYGIAPRVTAPREVAFEVTAPNRYLSVHFHGEDNHTPKSGWIKHMLCLFVDPPETESPRPDGPGTAVYSPTADPEALLHAKTIYFPAGYHNLRAARSGKLITDDGQLLLQDGQSLYLEGGAFVEGLVDNADRRNTGQRVYGRGLLTGRQYLWRNHPDHSGPEYRHLVGVGNQATVEGVTLMESPNHGIVGWTTLIENVKFLGWHCNNDAVRVGSGSEISHSFFRAVDDHFYNFNIHVHDVVLWAGHNGAILTYGWGGENTYHSGASLLENIDVIHPEWTGLGNNNGLVAAQVGLDYRPFGYGGETTTVIRNVRIEGSVPGLLNLKPLSDGQGIKAPLVAPEKVGYLGDLLLENVTVGQQTGKSRLQGKTPASTAGNGTFFVQNVTFRNLRIAGEVVTEETKGEYFAIDGETTRDVSFETR